jgi:hypothetical protein
MNQLQKHVVASAIAEYSLITSAQYQRHYHILYKTWWIILGGKT